MLENQHRVSEREETVTLLNCHFIGRHGLFVAVQRGHQHDEGTLRQVEVGDEAVNAVELDTRVQEDGGVAAAGFDLAILGGNGFQGAAAGGSNRNDAVPGGLGLPDALGGFLADGVPFAVHLVVRDLIFHHGAECAQTHMEGHFSNADPLGPDGVHQLRSEMQAGCGRCGTAKLLGIHRLVLALVFQLFGDIGRQRHFAKLIQFFIKGLCVIIECNVLVAILHGFIHHSGQGAVTKADLGAGLHPLAGLCQALPLVAFDLTEEQQLTDSAGGLLDANDAGRQDLGIVDDEQVARLQIFGQVVEDPVLDAVVFLAQNHQPCRVAGVCGLLCNELFG